MASITFNGPGLDGQPSETVVNMDDAALLAVIEAVNMLELGKLHETPGLFVIERAVAGWKHCVQLYQEGKARKTADEAVEAQLAPLRDSIRITVDGVEIPKPEPTPKPEPEPEQ